MIKDLLNRNIFLKVLSIPLLLSGIGIAISNQYLAQYGVTDFSLLQTKSVFTGFIFTLITVVYIVFLMTFVRTDELDKERFWVLVLGCVIKYMVWSIAFLTLVIEDSTNYSKVITFSSISLPLGVFKSFGVIILLVYMMFFTFWSEFISNAIHNKRYVIIRNVAFLLVSLLIIIDYIVLKQNSTAFSSINSYFLAVGLWVLMYLIGGKDRSNMTEQEIKKEKGFFSFSNKTTKLDTILYGSFFIVLLAISVRSYSSNLYPYLSSKWGGANKPTTIFTLESTEQISGEILKIDNQYYFIKVDSSLVKVLSIDDIDSFSIKEGKNKD